VLRVTTIHASSAAATAAYYTHYLADAPGEAPGVWTGRQAARLGLGGLVNTDDLQTLLEGRDPTTGTPLGNPLVDRKLSNGKVVRAVAGFDATFSAPKSVSVWWALTGDPGLLAAHDLAVSAALGHLERYGATTRVRVNGSRQHPDTRGLTMATFRQSTSRADDPQLHTHAVISAKVQTEDGRWLALDARYLKRHQRTLGGLYQSVLRAELTHQYGVAWEPIVNGQAETSSPSAPARSTSRWRRKSRSSAPVRVATRAGGSAPRGPARPRPIPVAARPATVSPICGHGGRPKPPSSGGRERISTPPSEPPATTVPSPPRSPSRRSSTRCRCRARRGSAPT